MKILLVNASDSKGGAAIVARRLLHALNAQDGVQAKMLVATKSTDDEDVIALPKRWWLKKALDRIVVWATNGFSKKSLWLTDGGFFGNDITKRKEFQEADVIHLHWVNQGFLGTKDIEKVLRSGKKIVWTMHDMWVSTAICHYAGDCEKFKTTGCAHCPQLLSPQKERLSERTWQKKLAYYKDANLHLVPCSTWMGDHAKRSLLTSHLPVTVIPNSFSPTPTNLIPLPTSPQGRRMSPQTPSTLGAPLVGELEGGKGLVCFSAARIDTEIKGFDDFLAALQYLKHRKDIEIVLVGGINDESLFQQIPLPYRYLGYQKDMLSVYASVDCVVNCSRYETLPTTIVEAQAVGTTPVAYRQSGATDLIVDGETGYFAEYRDAESLARAMEKAIDAPINPEKLRQHVVDSYSADVIAKRHLKVYKSR